MPEVQGGFTRYTSVEKGQFAKDGDVWIALSISDSMEIVLNLAGVMVDIWDSASGEMFNPFPIKGEWLGGIGQRETPFTMPPPTKPAKDMTDEEIADSLRVVSADYSQESRSIRTMQRTLSDKDKRISELLKEKLKRAWAAAGRGGYQPRITPTTGQIALARYGMYSARTVTTRSYVRRYVPGGRSSFIS